MIDSGDLLASDYGILDFYGTLDFNDFNAQINKTLGAGNYYIGISQYFSNSNSNYSLQLSAISAPSSIASDPGNTLNTAYNIGTLTGTQTITEFVGSVDPIDYYKFSLTGTNNISLQLSGLTDKLYAELYYDSNNNGLIDSDDTLSSSYADPTTNDKVLISRTLGAGNYYIGISQFLSSNINSNYSLQLSAISAPSSIASDPGNTLNTAYNIGTLTGTQTITEFVGSVDPIDYYKFSLTGTNNISLQLSGLTDRLSAQLYYDSNNNGLIDSGDTLSSSYADPTTNDKVLISRTLGAGNYYIGISQFLSSNINSNYSLQLSAISAPSSIASDPGNTLNTAYNIGTLTGTQTITEFVGSVDPIDYYKFSLTGTNNISLQLSGLTDRLSAQLYYDSNNNGLIDSGDTLSSSYADPTTNDKVLISRTLGAGNYYIGISPFLSSNRNSNYSLTLVNITNPNPSITLAVAPSSVTEDGTGNLVYTFSRTGGTANALTVNYEITGTADSADYTGATPGTGKTITFAAGASTTTLTIDPTADTTVEPDETVVLTLASGTDYTIGTTTAVTGTITNDDVFTPIESAGNTKLVKDSTNKYFTQVGTNTPTAIKNGGQQIYQNIYPGWQTLAAETVNGVNQVLWKNVAGNYLHIWRLDSNWNLVSSEGQFGLNSADAFTQETNFGIDANGDGVMGNPYATIESAGNTKLVKDTTNKYFTQVGTNTPTAIKNGGQQIYQNIYPGWQTLAAETVNGVNQVLWKNVAGNYLHIWRLDSNWNLVSSEGQFGLNSADAFTQETNFGIDANGDGVMGNPYATIESAGNTKLVKDTTNKYFTQVGTNTPTAIKNGGQQIYQNIYAGWQTLAAETVNGVNQVLWKNVAGNYLHIWRLDSNWNLVSSEGQFGLNSADAFTQETNFSIDANGDGVMGNPYATIESAGNTKLVKDTTNKYFTQVGTNTPTAIKNGGQQIYQNIYPGWQTLAAETVNGVNQVLWKNVAGNYLHIWRLDSNWNLVSSEGQFGLNSADAFTQETNFGIDANGDGVIGNPYATIESAGNTKLVKDTTNKYFTQLGTNTPTAIKNGGQQIYQNIYAGWQTLAAETVNGVNQVLWKNVAGNYLHIWRLDSNWNLVSSEGQFGLNLADAFTQETNFDIDANGDGVIGNPAGNPYILIESAGNTKLVKDTANKYFAQVGTNTPTAIQNSGVQIFSDIYPGWQTLAVETVNGDNQVLWKNVAGNYLHIWHLDNSWNRVSSEGQFGLNSADAFTQETNFGIDANGDGIIGNPYTLVV